MNNIMKASLITLSVLFSVSTLADVLTLKDGQTLTGKLVSQDAKGVVFEIAGQQLTFDTSKVQGISFGETSSTAAPTAPPSINLSFNT